MILPSPGLLEALAPLGPVPGSPHLLAHQAPDVFALWMAWESEAGAERDIPFWAVVWPAAQVMARFLAKQPWRIRDKSVLDVGAGGGLAGVAAAKAGAREVTCNDIDPAALAISRLHAEANGVALGLTGGDLVGGPCPDRFDVILVGDMFYEKSQSARMLVWLREAQGRGKSVLIADGSRPFGPREGVALVEEETVATQADLEGGETRNVRILTLQS